MARILLGINEEARLFHASFKNSAYPRNPSKLMSDSEAQHFLKSRKNVLKELSFNHICLQIVPKIEFLKD